MTIYFESESGALFYGDCLEIMKDFPDNSVDMILCDLPYGTTSCKWDIIIPFEPLWEQYNRIVKKNGAMIFTAREPFTSLLVTSNIKNYRHKWVWNKKQSGNPVSVRYMPLQIEEDIIVFSNGKANYYPIMRTGKFRKKGGSKTANGTTGFTQGDVNYNDQYYPTNIIEIVNPRLHKVHPTQKPVELFEYLIRTYSKEGDIILDNAAGSGTTAIACENTGRKWICIEKEEKYCEVIKDRLEELG